MISRTPPLAPRILHAPALLPGKATAVVGMRRAGKTYFLHQQRAERIAAVVERECRALPDASRDHPTARAVLIVGVTAGMPRMVPAGIACTTAAAWLLGHGDA